MKFIKKLDIKLVLIFIAAVLLILTFLRVVPWYFMIVVNLMSIGTLLVYILRNKEKK